MSYQAFIFSNVDMGPNNAFYLDNGIVPLHYQNLYGIAFNGSSRVLIRYYSTTVNQNMAVFIIPAQNCQQHALFAMSKNLFRIKMVTKKFDYNLQTCAFCPSFVSDQNRAVTFGYENSLNANAQIFYGFTPESIEPKSTLSKERNYTNNFYNKIVEELDSYHEIKKKYRNTYNKHKSNNKINTLKFNLFRSFSKSETENYSNELQKDYEEETYFKKIHKKYHILAKPMHKINNNQTNTYSVSQSPGFLASLKISSESRKINTVNTTYYVSYNVEEPNVNARILLNQEFVHTKSNKRIDSSMRDKHSDFLLYYDKYNSNFIYDNDWVDDIEISYNIDIWKMLKWMLLILVFIFIVITLLIIGCICGCVRSDRFCCFTRKNFDHEYNDESEINLNSTRTRHGSGRGIFNESQIDDYQLDTICYSPNLDEDVTYAPIISKKQKNESENYSYEYEYDLTSDDSSQDRHKKKRKIKKKKEINSRNNSSIAASPYEFDVGSFEDINQIFVNETDNRSSRNNNLHSIEESEEIPNPYGLPYLSPSLNDNEDGDKNVCNPNYPLC